VAADGKIYLANERKVILATDEDDPVAIIRLKQKSS
jgi:hypothetical protein